MKLAVASSRLKKHEPFSISAAARMNGLRLCCKQHEIRDPYSLVLMAQTACNVILWGIFCLAHHGTLSTDHSLIILMGCGDVYLSGMALLFSGESLM